MAFISAEDVRAIRNALKETFKNTKFSVKLNPGSHSAVTVTMLSAPDSFVDDENGRPLPYADINYYHYQTSDNVKHKKVIEQIFDIIKTAPKRTWYDNSNSMIDYFDTAFYFHLHQGSWNRHFEIKKPKGKR